MHGDLRANNILVSGIGAVTAKFRVVLNYGTGARVALIDFEWSGSNSTTNYPFFINPEIKWPEGVQGGTKLAMEHDDAWISREFL